MPICANPKCNLEHNNKKFCSNACSRAIFKQSQHVKNCRRSEDYFSEMQEKGREYRPRSVSQDTIDEFYDLSF